MMKVGDMVRIHSWLPRNWYEVIEIDEDGTDKFGDKVYKISIKTDTGVREYCKQNLSNWIIKENVDKDKIVTIEMDGLVDQAVEREVEK